MVNRLRGEPSYNFIMSIGSVDSGCWQWLGTLNRGYGYFMETTAHRFSYQVFKGEIPEGLQIDHLCRNRSCTNPDHLEPVTLKENVLRGEGISAKNLKKTHCPKGHKLTDENLYLYKGGRGCRTCRYVSVLKYKAKFSKRYWCDYEKARYGKEKVKTDGN